MACCLCLRTLRCAANRFPLFMHMLSPGRHCRVANDNLTPLPHNSAVTPVVRRHTLQAVTMSIPAQTLHLLHNAGAIRIHYVAV